MKLSKKIAVAASAGVLGVFTSFAAYADDAAVTHRGFKLVDKEDTSVQLYGLIDITLGAKSNAGAIGTANAGRTQAGAYTGWLSGNRWGIYSTHVIDKSSQTKIIHRLEGEYLGWNGTFADANTIFGRDAWVGFESPALGKLTFGRQNTVARDFSQIGSFAGGAKLTTEEAGYTNLSTSTSDMLNYSKSAYGSRADGSIVWKKIMGPVVAGLMYSFGSVQNGANASNTSVVGNFNSGSTIQGAIGYNLPSDLGAVALTATHMNVKTASQTTLATVRPLNQDFVTLSAHINIVPKMLYVKGQYAHASIEQDTLGQRIDNAYALMLGLTPGKFHINAGATYIDAVNAGRSATASQMAGSDPRSVTTTGSGKRVVYITQVMYSPTSQLDLYLQCNHVQTSDRWTSANTNGYRNMTEAGLGMRYKF